jgi:hypothetical protein
LEVSDRIRLQVEGLDALAGQFDFVAREVLATEIVSGRGEGEGTVLELDDADGAAPPRVWLQKAEVAS